MYYGETQDKNEIHGPYQSLDNYHWPKGFMKIEIPLITSCQNYNLLKPLDVFTDSDAIMNYTLDIPSYIATIKFVLFSGVGPVCACVVVAK